MELPDPHVVTVTLAAHEAEWLSKLAMANGMSEDQVMRQALRLYQTVNVRLHMGDRLAFVDASGEPVGSSTGLLKNLPKKSV